MLQLFLKKLNPDAREFTRGSVAAAGYDIHASVAAVVPAHGRICVSTGIAIMWRSDARYYFRISPRSGLSMKGIDVGAGVIDEDYRGEIGVILINHTDKPFEVKVGDRVAQGIFERIEIVDSISVVDNLTDTERGSGGFGSTGI